MQLVNLVLVEVGINILRRIILDGSVDLGALLADLSQKKVIVFMTRV